jgi:hypothetical protein
MAINPGSSYPGQIDTTDPAYPLGKAQNISAPSAGDGTPWEQLLINDQFGFQQALLNAAAIVASGAPDEVGASQYLQALQALFEPVFSKNTAFNKDFGSASGEVCEGNDARLPTTDEKGAMTNASAPTAANPFATVGQLASTVQALRTDQLLYIEDQKISGTAGQTLTAASWDKRDLNASVVANISGASVSASVITLPAGTYWVEVTAPAGGFPAGIHQARFRNTSDSVTEFACTSQGVDYNVITPSMGAGLVTIAATKNFEVQHTTNANRSGGVAGSFGTEVYTRIKIWRVL